MSKEVNTFNNLVQALGIDKVNKLAVAVSGGPDSMLMLHLLSQIMAKSKIHVISIDHGLRQEAIIEQKLVKDFCAKHGIKFFGTKIQDSHLIKNQQDGRDKRFEIIHKYCADNDIKHLCIGHNLDDAIENFFIRINRGSGLDGLDVLNFTSYQGNIKVVRPLLFLYKKQILELNDRLGIKYLVDQSNYSLKHKRNAFRHLINANKSLFEKKHIVTTMVNLARAHIFKQKTYEQAVKNCVNALPFGVVEINLDQFQAEAAEIQLELLANIILMVGENQLPLRLKSLTRLHKNLFSKNAIKVTLGNCKIEKLSNIVIFYKEYIDELDCILEPGQAINIAGFELALGKKATISYHLKRMTNKIWQKYFSKHQGQETLELYKNIIPVLIPNDLNYSPQIPTLITDSNISFYWNPKNSLISSSLSNENDFNIIYKLVESGELG